LQVEDAFLLIKALSIEDSDESVLKTPVWYPLGGWTNIARHQF
jgi:hypothetical protein